MTYGRPGVRDAPAGVDTEDGERSGCHIQVTDSADQRELKADRLRELTQDAAGGTPT